jgi:pimeloyl-ACP methyl ester carboxylesterase
MPASVVLVHGLRSRSAELEPVRQLLSEAGHDVVAPDLPGHGLRTHEQFSIGESLVTIAEAANTVGGAPVLIGHALGGHLAVQCASLTGDAAAVIAVGCGTDALGWLLDSYRIASNAHRVLPDRGAALSAMAATTFVGGVPRHTRASVPGQFFDTLGHLDTLDTPGALARLDVPVWLLNGQFDRFRFQERAYLSAAAKATLVRQTGVRLAGRITRPDATARLLERILAQLP